MSRIVSLLILVVGLCGCVGVTDVAHPFDPGERWGADRTSEGERLAFGVPDTDDVSLEFTCQPHSGRVEVFASAGVDRPTLTITFTSGAAASRHFMKRLESDNGYGGFITADDPALVAFSQTGEIATSVAGKRRRFPPAQVLAGAFLKACR